MIHAVKTISRLSEQDDEMKKNINQIKKDKFFKRYSKGLELTNHWAQVHNQNESTNLHDHVDCFDIKNSPDLSGVYYLEVPKDSGDIVFQWPINKYNQYKRWWFKPKSGDFLFKSLHKVNISNQDFSNNKNDGLRLKSTYITNILKCVPPGDKPKNSEPLTSYFCIS